MHASLRIILGDKPRRRNGSKGVHTSIRGMSSAAKLYVESDVLLVTVSGSQRWPDVSPTLLMIVTVAIVWIKMIRSGRVTKVGTETITFLPDAIYWTKQQINLVAFCTLSKPMQITSRPKCRENVHVF